jgi:RNA polymerase sigma-70 factor (ECF subfamily)
MNISDKNLVKNLKDDDVSAFDELYKRYHLRVFQLGMRFLPYKEDAEDIVQIVFIAVWDNRHKIIEDQNFGSYVLSIARHSIYNALRKAVYRQGYMDYLQQKTPDNAFITEEAVLFNELDTVLHGILESIPPKRGEIFRLHREEGLSYKEISDRLSISGSTVNTQLTKAISYVRQHIRLFYQER